MSLIQHSVCRWCYDSTPLEDLCLAARDIGISSVELVMPQDMPVLQKHGLTCAMISFPLGTTPDGVRVGGIEKAFNRLEHHDTLVEIYQSHLRAAAAAGAKQVICFSGNREGISADEGLANCASGLRRLLPLAEELGITLCMELLNSKIDHPDYQCDHSAWGIQLCEILGSANFGLLYDIYHMQIMEGDIIRSIRENHRYFTHYHTGGCPGRNEIDETQELHYPAIMRAIAATGYTGFVGQEFLPTTAEPFGSLRRAVEICSV
ncbi:MAG: Hydroxypyruvate isomerase [Verrucomicrobiota bacterium]